MVAVTRRRPGYYVEGRYFGFNIAQAQARAAFLTQEYGRSVRAVYVASDGSSATVPTTDDVRASESA